MSTAYYHGSVGRIRGDYLMPREQWNSVQNAKVTGAFVTTDKNYAKFFAINRCVSDQGQVQLENKKIYFEHLADKIRPHFYVYTVFETPDSAFIHDKGREYYSKTPIKIAGIKKYNTANEIDKLGYEIYVLDEPFNGTGGEIKSTDNFARQNYMKTAIQSGKFHRVDIKKLLQEQNKNTFKTATNNIKAKVRYLLQRLQNMNHVHN